MTPEQTIEKAIKIARANGWKTLWLGDFQGIEADPITGELFTIWKYSGLLAYGHSLMAVIFNHDFAKALWGEEPLHYTVFITEETYGEYKRIIAPPKIDELYAVLDWQYHLQQMVISPDPIKYLADHLA